MSGPQINPAEQIEREFAQERASALGRLGRALEAALAALSEFDRARAPSPPSTAETRARPGSASHHPSEAGTKARTALVSEASLALWQFAVQREACGLRDLRQVLRDYAVPEEVAARMGVLPPSRALRRTHRQP